MIFDHLIVHKVQFAEKGDTIIVETEGQKVEAENFIKDTRPFDNIKVKVEPQEDYDGERFIIPLTGD